MYSKLFPKYCSLNLFQNAFVCPVPVEGPEEEGEDVGDNDHEQHPAEVHKNRDHGKSNNECIYL